MAAPAASTNAAVRASIVALMTTTFGPASAYAGAVHDSRSTPIDQEHTHPAVNVIADLDREAPMAKTSAFMLHGLKVRVQIFDQRDDGDEAALADTLDAHTLAARGALFGDDAWRDFFHRINSTSGRTLVDSSTNRARGMAELTLDLEWEVEHTQTDPATDRFSVADIDSTTAGVNATVDDIYT